MNEGALIRQAEDAAYGEDARNYRIRLDQDTALAIRGLLKLEETDAEISGRWIPIDEDLDVMLSRRVYQAIRLSAVRHEAEIELDINFRELRRIGQHLLMQGSRMAQFYINLSDAFIQSGGKTDGLLRPFFEGLSKQ